MIKTLFFTEQSLAKKYETEIFNALVHLEILLLRIDPQSEQRHLAELVGWAMKLKERCLSDKSVDFAGDVVKQYWKKKTSVQQTTISLRIKSEIKKKYPKADLYYFTKENTDELVDRYSRIVDANSKEDAASYIRRKMGVI